MDRHVIRLITSRLTKEYLVAAKVRDCEETDMYQSLTDLISRTYVTWS